MDEFDKFDEISALGASSSGNNYEMLYHLTLALAVVVGFIFAILVGCEIITKRKIERRPYAFHETIYVTSGIGEKITQFIVLLVLGGGVTLLVWGSYSRALSHPSTTDQDEANALACIIFGAIAVAALYPCIAVRLMTDLKDARTNVLVVSVYFLLLPGLVALSIAYKNLMRYDHYDYINGMNITKSEAVFQTDLRCHHGGVCDGYRGQIELSWSASSESCPNSPNDRNCSVILADPRCDQFTWEHYGGITIQTESEAIEKTTICLNVNYNLEDFFVKDNETDGVGGNIVPVNGTWPTVDAYGTCSSGCEAAFEVPDDLLNNLKMAGTIMTITGATIMVVSVCASLIEPILPGTSSRRRRVVGDASSDVVSRGQKQGKAPQLSEGDDSLFRNPEKRISELDDVSKWKPKRWPPLTTTTEQNENHIFTIEEEEEGQDPQAEEAGENWDSIPLGNEDEGGKA